jgi:Flp pilus assembly protein TadG
MSFVKRRARKTFVRNHLIGSRRRAGAATVELTVRLPVLVLIVIGAIETCSFIHLNESLITASYEGARVMSMPTSTREDGVRRCSSAVR